MSTMPATESEQPSGSPCVLRSGWLKAVCIWKDLTNSSRNALHGFKSESLMPMCAASAIKESRPTLLKYFSMSVLNPENSMPCCKHTSMKPCSCNQTCAHSRPGKNPCAHDGTICPKILKSGRAFILDHVRYTVPKMTTGLKWLGKWASSCLAKLVTVP